MAKKILIIEDVVEHALIVKSVLSGYDIEVVKSVKEARKLLEERFFDLALLDLNLEDGSGMDLIANQSKFKCKNFIICSERSEISSKVAGFSLGVHDYICKPYSPIELKLRVDRILNSQQKVVLESDGLRINLSGYVAEVLEEDKWRRLDLTTVELKILNYFLTKEEVVLTRDNILNAALGEDVYSGDRTVDTHISKLRKKLGPKGKRIKSIYGAGYVYQLNSAVKAA